MMWSIKAIIRRLNILFKEYCAISSIHGIRYIGDAQRPMVERFIWLCIVTIAIVVCAFFTSEIFVKFRLNPILVSFEERPTPIWQIPFPSVTICPLSKNFNYDRITERFFLMKSFEGDDSNNFTKSFTDEEIEKLSALSVVCRDGLLDGYLPNKLIKLRANHQDDFNETIIHKLIEMFTNRNHIIKKCLWQNTDCKNDIDLIFTDEGICFTFNFPQLSDVFNTNRYDMYERLQPQLNSIRKPTRKRVRIGNWSLENGYPKLPIENSKISTIENFREIWQTDEQQLNFTEESTPIDIMPRRSTYFGPLRGLNILMRLDNTIEHICRSYTSGYKIYLHNPEEVPFSSYYGLSSRVSFMVPVNEQIEIILKPKVMTTMSSLHPYLPKRRECYFDGERPLAYINLYTQSNCELECLTNYTLLLCGCVRFFMPRLRNTPICGPLDIECYRNAEQKLIKKQIIENLVTQDHTAHLHTDIVQIEEENVPSCDCFPACNSILYEHDISQTKIDFKIIANRLNRSTEDVDNGMFNFLTIRFSDNLFVRDVRSERYGTTDLLAHCGGFFGLFLGFSILSVVEFIYFYTFKLLWQDNQRESVSLVDAKDTSNDIKTISLKQDSKAETYLG